MYASFEVRTYSNGFMEMQVDVDHAARHPQRVVVLTVEAFEALMAQAGFERKP